MELEKAPCVARFSATQATRNAEFVHVANTILKVRFAQIVFVFAIKFSTFNKGFRSRQFCGYLFRTSCSLKPLAVSLKDNTKTENLEINEQLIKDN